MAATPEGKVKAVVVTYLKSLGPRCWYFMPVSNGMGKRGIPDIICCIDGKFVAIETKAPGKLDNVTPHQLTNIQAIQVAGGVAHVTDNGPMTAVWLKVLGVT